jgi:hypothetical protein
MDSLVDGAGFWSVTLFAGRVRGRSAPKEKIEVRVISERERERERESKKRAKHGGFLTNQTVFSHCGFILSWGGRVCQDK